MEITYVDSVSMVTKHGEDELGTDRGALKFAATSSAGMWMQQFSGGGVDRFALALPGFLQVATTRQQWSRTARLGQGQVSDKHRR